MSVFTHAGVSKLNGEFKVRFANDALRVKVLAKNGHSDIDIVELKTPMNKEDAISYLMAIDFATQNGVTNAAVQAALEEAIDKRVVKAPKAKAAPKAAGQDGSSLTPQQEQEVTALRKQAEALKPDHAASTAAFLAFYQKYENHAEGWLAGMMAAHSMIGDNKLANASTLLEGIASKSKADATYQALANLELAGIAEEQGEYDRELSILTNLEISTNSDLKPKLQLMRGRALFLKGDKAGAKTTLNTLIEGYSSSTEAQKARSLLTLIN